MNPLATLGLGMGSAWLSGFNLYATVLTLGLLQRFHMVALPGDLEFLSRGWVLGVAAALYLVEFIADKIPVVASAFAHFDPAVRAIALLAGGTLALGSQGTKATVRATANASPEPFSNAALSLFEDFFTVALAAIAAFHPVVILGIVLAFAVMLLWLAPKAIRAIRRELARMGAFFRGSETP